MNRVHRGFQKEVYDALCTRGPSTCVEIASTLGVTKDCINGQMRKLHNKGLVKVVSSRPHTGNIWAVA